MKCKLCQEVETEKEVCQDCHKTYEYLGAKEQVGDDALKLVRRTKKTMEDDTGEAVSMRVAAYHFIWMGEALKDAWTHHSCEFCREGPKGDDGVCGDCREAKKYLVDNGIPMDKSMDVGHIFRGRRKQLEKESGMKVSMQLVAVTAVNEMKSVGKMVAMAELINSIGGAKTQH